MKAERIKALQKFGLLSPRGNVVTTSGPSMNWKQHIEPLICDADIPDKLPKPMITPKNPQERKGNTVLDTRSLTAHKRHQELVKIERENIMIAQKLMKIKPETRVK